MAERIQGIIIVSLIAVMIWLAAEAESLGTTSVPARTVFLAQDLAGEGRIIVSPKDWDGSVTLDLRGSRAALQSARTALESRIELRPGASGIPGEAGEYSVDLLTVLQQIERLRGSGIVIESVSPRTVSVEVRELALVSLPIRAELPGVQIAGEIGVAPVNASVRMPRQEAKAIAEAAEVNGGPGVQVIAQPTSQQLALLGEAGLKSIQVALQLPESLRGRPNIEILTRAATLTFTTQSGVRTETLSAPVWTLLPSIEVGGWQVTVDPGDQLLTVKVTGPNAIMDRLRGASPADRLVAVVELSSDDLDKRIESKVVSFMLLRDTGQLAIPESLKFEPAAPVVRFTVSNDNDELSAGPGADD